MNLNHNETQFFNTWSFENETEIKNALTYLNQKLNEITRQVSFWDIYNVTQVLLSDGDLTSKIALLSPGEAAIVNANVLNNGKETHWRGDVAYRKVDGEIVWIPAENKGVYKPNISYDTLNNMLKITYTYQTGISEDGEDSYFVGMDTETRSTYLIDIDTKVSFNSGVFTFTALYDGGDNDHPINPPKLIKPIIKFYYKNISGAYEEFYPDYKWSEDTSTTPEQIKVEATFPSSAWVASGMIYMRVR